MTNPRRRRRRPIAPPYTPPQPFPFAYPAVPQPPAFKEPPRASVQVLRDKNATVANVTVSQMTDYTRGPDYTFETSGSTKREQGDRYDPQTGDLMAIGRALRNAGNEMITEANRRVQEIVEDQAEERRRALQRRLAKAEPPKRRTREEWERIQRIRKNAALAQGLGLNIEQNEDRSDSMGGGVGFHHSSVAEWGGSAGGAAPVTNRPEGARIELTNGRHITIEDDVVVLRSETGAFIMGFQRV